MKYGSEIIKIIEAGLEGDEEKVRAYAIHLMNKLEDDDHTKTSISNRLDGSYKDQQTLKICQTCGNDVGKPRADNGLSYVIHCDGCFDKMVSEARNRSW